MTLQDGPMRTLRPGALMAGLVLLAAGAAMLLDTTGTLSIQPGRLIGPFVLIGLGASLLAGGHSCVGRDGTSRSHDGTFSGLWLIGIGCWLLVSHTHVFGLTFGTSWPLLLIWMGLLISIRGWR